MLFDVYFNLGGFFFGLYAGFAFHAQPNGAGHALAVAMGIAVLMLCVAGFGWHMRHHSQENQWTLARRMMPVLFYAIGLSLSVFAGR